MKRKRCIALILALAAFFTLSSGNAWLAPAAEAQNEDSSEMTWSASFTDVVLPEGLEYLQLSTLTENGFYALSSEEIPGSGENEADGYSTYEPRILFLGFDGKASLLENYEPFSPVKETAGKYDYYVNSYPQIILPFNNGELAVIEAFSESWVSKEGMTSDSEEYWQYYSYNQEFWFRLLNADGSEKLCWQIPVEKDQYLNSAVLDKNGNIVCLCGDTLLVFSPEGELIRTIGNGCFYDSLVIMRSGALFATAWGETGVELYPLDTQKGEFGSARKLPEGAFKLIPGGGKYPLYYSEGGNCCGFDAESGEGIKLFNWLSTNVAQELYSDFGVRDDGSVVGMVNDADNGLPPDGASEVKSAYRLFEVKQVPASSVKEKKTLTMAVEWMRYDAGQAALLFNRTNEDYKIEILDYSVYNTGYDYSAAGRKLLEDIMAGNAPDIIALDSVPVSILAEKGLLEDLYPFVDGDPEFSREEFFPNVLALCERDGKLVSTTSGFWISTVVGASSVVGDTPGWTYEEFAAALASMPEGCRPLGAMTTRGDILSTCLSFHLDKFVNRATGECRFDNEVFATILKFASHFPENIDWDNYDWEKESDDVSIADGRQMLATASVSGMEDITYNDYYFGGLPYTYIGYPTASGTGNYMTLSSRFAMSSSCADKEAAWQFLRIFFTDSYQKQQYTLPASRVLFEAKLKEAMDSFLSQEQADKLRELVETTTCTATMEENIETIVKEQAESFFRGEKSIEEVSALIQNAVSRYIHEAY